ncbi:hypothetical protein C8Q70DRAFT_949776 [Cubamyces menziesii]|nr:hypothetical protein C8Q70DRAFT_949776 [Cubamyces menziesii]
MQQATPAASTSNASPGTKEYLPDLFARARITHPDLPLDPVIVQSLLICLIAQPRSPTVSEQHAHDRAVRPGLHLILRTKEEDVGLVVNLVALLVAENPFLPCVISPRVRMHAITNRHLCGPYLPS